METRIKQRLPFLSLIFSFPQKRKRHETLLLLLLFFHFSFSSSSFPSPAPPPLLFVLSSPNPPPERERERERDVRIEIEMKPAMDLMWGNDKILLQQIVKMILGQEPTSYDIIQKEHVTEISHTLFLMQILLQILRDSTRLQQSVDNQPHKDELR